MMIVDDIYGEFEDWLRRFAMGLTHDGDRADDLVQDTMIRALAHLHLLESMAHYQRRSWLRRTLKNLFIDEYRSFSRQRSLIERLSSDTVSMTGDISEELEYADLLDGIPKQDARLLHDRYVLGRTSREIAGDLGLPAATVRSRLHVAIKRLRERRDEFLY